MRNSFALGIGALPIRLTPSSPRVGRRRSPLAGPHVAAALHARPPPGGPRPPREPRREVRPQCRSWRPQAGP